jgi:hypothetical protein
LSVWQVLHGTPSAQRISAQRVARFDGHCTSNLFINNKLRQRYSGLKVGLEGFEAITGVTDPTREEEQSAVDPNPLTLEELRKLEARNAHIGVLLPAVDIVAYIGQYVALAAHDTRFVGKCPFHEREAADTTTPFTVARRSDVGLFYCRTCHAGGDVLDFVRQHQGVTLEEAVQIVQEYVDNALSQED